MAVIAKILHLDHVVILTKVYFFDIMHDQRALAQAIFYFCYLKAQNHQNLYYSVHFDNL